MPYNFIDRLRFGLGLGIVLSLASNSYADVPQCAEALRLRSTYAQAQKSQDLQKSSQTLAALLKSQAQQLGFRLPEKIALKAYSQPEKTKRSWKDWRKYIVSKSDALDLLWCIGPFFFRGISQFGHVWFENWGKNRLLKKTNHFDPKIVGPMLGLTQDRFLNESLKELRMRAKRQLWISSKKAARRWYTPAGLALLFSLYGVHPLMIPYSVVEYGRLYSQIAYFNDLEKKANISFENKKIVVIVDKKLMTENGYGHLATQEDPTGISYAEQSYAHIKSQAGPGNFKGIPVGSMAELKKALNDSRDADVRILAFHGLMGTFFVGDEDIINHLHEFQGLEMKEGSVTIFGSCLSGNHDASQSVQEQPISQFSNIIYNGRSGPVITSSMPVAAVPTFTGFGAEFVLNHNKLKEAPELFLNSGLGIESYMYGKALLTEPLVDKAQDASGFQIYNPATGKAEFIQHTSPK